MVAALEEIVKWQESLGEVFFAQVGQAFHHANKIIEQLRAIRVSLNMDDVHPGCKPEPPHEQWYIVYENKPAVALCRWNSIAIHKRNMRQELLGHEYVPEGDCERWKCMHRAIPIPPSEYDYVSASSSEPLVPPVPLNEDKDNDLPALVEDSEPEEESTRRVKIHPAMYWRCDIPEASHFGLKKEYCSSNCYKCAVTPHDE